MRPISVHSLRICSWQKKDKGGGYELFGTCQDQILLWTQLASEIDADILQGLRSSSANKCWVRSCFGISPPPYRKGAMLDRALTVSANIDNDIQRRGRQRSRMRHIMQKRASRHARTSERYIYAGIYLHRSLRSVVVPIHDMFDTLTIPLLARNVCPHSTQSQKDNTKIALPLTTYSTRYSTTFHHQYCVLT